MSEDPEVVIPAPDFVPEGPMFPVQVLKGRSALRD
jgi:hypothetical protein